MTAYLDGYSGYSGVPEDAAAEILEKLMTHQQISSDEVAQILKRYGVRGEPEALQIAYRKKVGQRLIASLRDPYGRREVFSTGSTYVLVDCCNDRDALEHIHKKLDKDIMSNGLCLTANILESLNQDGGCSLSDILIPDAPEKYFLSLEQMQKLLYRSSMDGWANESMILPESPAHRTPADNPDSTL